jgi:uncharacterized protein YigA (DUF484 family)
MNSGYYMAESHVISGLVSKRSELAGLLDYHRKEINKIMQSLTVLDNTIKLFEPSYRLQSIEPKRYQRKNSFFKNGEANRVILDVLRSGESPMSTSAIAKAIMTLNGIGDEHEKPLQASILTTLHNQKKKGLVDFTGRDRNGSCLWELVD